MEFKEKIADIKNTNENTPRRVSCKIKYFTAICYKVGKLSFPN